MLLPQRRSAELNGACAKAASGALDLLPIVEVVNLARSLAELQQRGYWIVGLDAAGANGLDELDLPPRIVLVLGSEGEGLRRLVADHCDFLARLEIDARMESLNVSVAAGHSPLSAGAALSPAQLDHPVDQRIQVGLLGAVVAEAGANGEPAADLGGRRCGDAALVQLDHDRGIEPVECCRSSPGAW